MTSEDVNLKKAAEYVGGAEIISLLPHISADGDSIGAAFALKLAFWRLGKQVTVYLEEEIQKRYLFAVDGIDFKIVDDGEEAGKIASDLVIILDCAVKNRLGNRVNILDNAKKTMCIDHHVSSGGEFADLNYIDTKWAAACIGVYKLINELNIKMADRIASLIYIGLVTDTGGFRFSNTNPEAHIIAADLIKYNIDTQQISMNVFDNITYGRYMLTGEIGKRTEFFYDGKVCVCYLPEEAFIEHGATEEDGDGIVNYLRNIEGVEVAVYIKDKKDDLKISMRSKNYVDVSSVAQIFSGGGHPRAAGANWDGDYSSLKEKLLAELGKVI